MDEWGNINLDNVAVRAFNKVKEQAADVNRKQLEQGKDVEGSLLPPYSKQYAKKRQKAGLQTAVKDLKFTGKFHKEIYAFAFDNYVEMGSKDPKEAFLYTEWKKANWGDFFGISDNELTDEFMESFKDALIEEIKYAIGL
jgi:hypothetical protein